MPNKVRVEAISTTRGKGNSDRHWKSRSFSTMHPYDGKTFCSVANAANGEVGSDTIFHYHQDGKIVWAEYSGGSIVKGSLIAVAREDHSLDMRYHHVNTNGVLMTGQCHSVPKRLADGRLQMHEKWEWTSGDCSKGESVIEEIAKV